MGTRLSFVSLLKKKSDVLAISKVAIAALESEANTNLKSLRTDGEGFTLKLIYNLFIRTYNCLFINMNTQNNSALIHTSSVYAHVSIIHCLKPDLSMKSSKKNPHVWLLCLRPCKAPLSFRTLFYELGMFI